MLKGNTWVGAFRSIPALIGAARKSHGATKMTSFLNFVIWALLSLWTQVQSDECPRKAAITAREVNEGHPGTCLIYDEWNCYYESIDGITRPTLRVPTHYVIELGRSLNYEVIKFLAFRLILKTPAESLLW